MIPYGRQDITQADIDAVTAVLGSDFLTQGPAVPRFEGAVAAVTRARHGIAMNSATSALHLACLALDLGKGDLLWTSPNTFLASANCARYCGADVDFVDIDPLTWNMCADALEEKLRHARKHGRLPKIVIPVHFGGQPTDQERIHRLSLEYGFRIIEDASHAIGGSRHGEPVGSCRWSDITILSFHPVKIITSGEGGMALTNDTMLADRMTQLRSHGMVRDPALMKSPSPGEWYYEQQELGFNYRMTDIHAALGTSQIDRLASYVEARNTLAERYNELLASVPVQRPLITCGNTSAFHLYVVRIAGDGVRNRVYRHMREAGIGVNVHYAPVHLQPYYRSLGFNPGMFPEAETYGQEALTLPLYPRLSTQEQDTVVRALKAAV